MILNNFRTEGCPLCRSKTVIKAGDIAYQSNLSFSSNAIELERTPELWRCKECHSFFVQNAVPEAEAVRLYSQGNSSERWSTVPFTSNKPVSQVECLSRYFSAGKRVLDIGCNTGELLDFAHSLGCKTAGVEYSRTSRAILTEKGHAAYASLREVTKGFDVITAFDVVEHLYDIPAFFASCKDLIRQDGFLILLTGDPGSFSARYCRSNWWYVQHPEHIVFPSKEFFIRYSGFSLTEWIPTYASVNFQHGWLKTTRDLFAHFVLRNYRGLPSIGPDHVLAVLKNKV